MYSKRKIHSDILLNVSNTESHYKEINIWDGLHDKEKEKLVKSFIIGSIRMWSTNVNIFGSANLIVTKSIEINSTINAL